MEKQKRERSSNFTQEETDLLVSLVESRILVIENKKSDSATWQEKEEAWKDIETAFNSLSGPVYRTHKHLKIKYEGLKRDIRKKVAVIRDDHYNGSGPSKVPQITPTEQKIMKMIISVEGNDSIDYIILMNASEDYQNNLVNDSKHRRRSSLSESKDCNNRNFPLNDHKDYVSTSLHDSDEDGCNPLNESKEYVMSQLNERNSLDENDPDLIMPLKHREKRPIDIITEEKIEVIKIQKMIALEDLEQKIIQRKILEKELEHKDVIHELDKQHLLLKIQMLKKALGIKDKIEEL